MAGISDYSERDLNALIEGLSHNGQMTPVARYRGGHLFQIYRDMSGLEKKIATKLAEFSHEDFMKFERFKERTLAFTDHADQRNCGLYVDAEQSFLQYGIESIGQQLTMKLNVNDKVIIMNGYQCYTTRTQELIPMEV